MITLDILSYIVYSLFGLLAVVFLLLIRTEVRLRRLLKGRDSKTIEDTLIHLTKNLKSFAQFTKKTDERLTKAEAELERSIQGVGIVRFNPFKGTSGSNQSFSTAFLTKRGDGVVVSSIYSREHTSVFAKPIERMESKFGLTEEEKEAIEQAST